MHLPTTQIFAADPDRNRVALTLKKTLLNSELPVFAGIGDVKVGAVVHAVVTKVMEKGLLVDFFGGGRGLVPIGEAACVPFQFALMADNADARTVAARLTLSRWPSVSALDKLSK